MVASSTFFCMYCIYNVHMYVLWCYKTSCVHAYLLIHVYQVYLCSSFWCEYEYASLSGGYGMIVLTPQRKYYHLCNLPKYTHSLHVHERHLVCSLRRAIHIL